MDHYHGQRWDSVSRCAGDFLPPMDEGTFSTYLIQTEKLVTRLVFDSKRMDDLRTGARCLDEVIKNQVQAIEDEERARREAIANGKAAVTKVWSQRKKISSSKF